MREDAAMTMGGIGPGSDLDDLRGRVTRIALLGRQGAIVGVARELHELKRVAHRVHFDAVEDLAHILEAEIAVSGVAAPIGVYMDCMDDAIACGMAGRRASETMFAAVRARMLS